VGAGVAEHVVKALVGHARGVTGDVYTDLAAIMDLMRDAVARVPAVGSSDTAVTLLGPARDARA